MEEQQVSLSFCIGLVLKKNSQQFSDWKSSLTAEFMVTKAAYNKNFASANLRIRSWERILVFSAFYDYFCHWKLGDSNAQSSKSLA